MNQIEIWFGILRLFNSLLFKHCCTRLVPCLAHDKRTEYYAILCSDILGNPAFLYLVSRK